MKISLKLAQHLSDVPLNKIGTDKLVEKIGAQLGAVEEVIEWGPKFDGVVVAKVVECIKHPNADKLHVCKVDDGKVTKSVARDSKGLVQVVCGAPNVKAGMLVAWLPPGTTVPSSRGKDPFVLDARELRGEMSNGMLASASELGISDDHSGLLEIEEKEAKPGMPFKQLYDLDDVVIDVENKMFTHRPDCFGHIGVARELAGIQHLKFKSHSWYLKPVNIVEGDELPLQVKVEDKKLVPRFMAVSIKNVKVGPSPIWLQSTLTRVGIRSINNIVDITNNFMIMTAQPMHAYDADKLLAVSGQKTLSLETRKSKKGEKLKLLNGKTLTFDDDSTVLITTHGVPVGVGGAMGGADTEVDENTKNIVLECATFDMYNIRRTSMKYGLFTDAVTRFNKGQSPHQNDKVLARAVQDLLQTAGGEVASKVQDVHGPLSEPASITITAQFINERLGLKLSLKEIAGLLENVEFEIKTAPADKTRLHIKPPFWRTDIEIPEDIVEEVGRLYGYDHLPLELPKRDLTPTPKDEILELKSQVRDILADSGANEVLTYSFVHGNLLDKVGQDKKQAYELSNAISPELQYYRMSLTPSLLDKIHPNIKAGYGEFAIFEINKIHKKGEMDLIEKDVPAEDLHVSLIFTADDKTAGKQFNGAAFYQAKKYLEQILPDEGSKLVPLSEFKLSGDKWGEQMVAPYDPKRSAVIVHEGMVWGIVGEFKASVRTALKLPVFTAGFEVSTEIIKAETTYMPLPRFPKVEQDISLKVAADLNYGELYDFVSSNLNAPENTHHTLSPIDIYRPEDDKTHKNITLRLSIASYEKTLKAEEVNKLLDEVAEAAKEKFGAERI